MLLTISGKGNGVFSKRMDQRLAARVNLKEPAHQKSRGASQVLRSINVSVDLTSFTYILYGYLLARSRDALSLSPDEEGLW